MGPRGWIGRRLVGIPREVRVRGGVGDGLVMGTALASADYADGTNELPVQEAIRDALKGGDVFYDIGANVGFFGLIAARLVGAEGAVYAFEPVPGVAAEARANAARNELANVHVIEAAASCRTGTATLVVTRHPGGASLSEADAGRDATGKLEVRTVRIDDLVAAGAVRPPDAVKIDVEGVEPDVIDGLSATLVSHRPTVVCELDAPEGDVLEAKVREVSAMLGELSFDVRLLPPSYARSGWHVLHLVATPV